MRLATGTRLGSHEVVSLLGAGGMGEVYRARDTKLNRDVALKTLPDLFANDSERRARFDREAKTLASLNHPHIAQIYGFEQSGDIAALVMELVEGEDLSRRVARGPIPLAEVLAIAQQIAAALEAAHEQGIVHRDLKPANIKVRDDGTVKVLDFGLAKALDPASKADVDPTASPTVTAPTARGAILGTAAYMSPEQAKGRDVDKRADLWAFGAVLYEMLTGRRPFVGDGGSDTIARVLLEEPDWSALPAGTPAPIAALLRRCLEKDRRRRLDSATAARFAIEDAVATAAGAPVGVSAPARVSIASIAAMIGAGVLILAMVAVLVRPESTAPSPPALFAIVPPPAQPLNLAGDARDIALSPNGRYLVYRSGGSMTGGSPLMLRALDELDARQIPGIDAALGPFFSPDSQWIGFFANGGLQKISISGGPIITICPATGQARGASWGDDGTIIFATGAAKTGLWRVSAAGGVATVLTTPDAAQNETRHSLPFIMPGSRSVLFTTTTTAVAGAVDTSQVAVLDLKTGDRKVLIRGASDATYLETGHLLYAAAGTLHARSFDPVRLDSTGDPVPVIERVMVAGSGAANYAVARNGTLTYVPGGIGAQRTPRVLVWVDRRGREELIDAPPRPYSSPRLSPDGTQVAVEVFDRTNELWIWSFSRAALRRFTLDPSFHGMPVWTRDGQRLIFASTRDGSSRLYEQASDGTGPAERLATPAVRATAITPDGTRVIGFAFRENAPSEIVASARAAAGSKPRDEIRFTGAFAEISPNGRYIAYQATAESGRIEIYVRPFPQVENGRWQVSPAGGTRAAWAHSGRELFYIDGSGLLTAVPVDTSATTFTFGNQAKVFDTRYAQPFPARHYDIAADDQRFLMMKDSNAGDPNATPASIVVILNWFEKLKTSARP